jgi:hypothetical protein
MSEWWIGIGAVAKVVSLYFSLVGLFYLVVLSRIFDWYRTNRFLRQMGRRRKRARCFASRFVFRTTMARKAHGMDIDELHWAFRLSDHRRKAKQVIEDEMRSRRITKDEIDSWAPPERDLIVPLSKPVAIPFPTYLQNMEWRRRSFAVIRYVSIAFLILSPVMILDVFILAKNPPIGIAVIAVISLVLWALITALLLLLWILTPVVAYYTRSHYPRILLLRPFGQRRLSIGLRRVIVRQFGIFGNVFTLSDHNYRPNRIINVIQGLVNFSAIVLGPVFRSSTRGARVKNERTFLKFARFLHRRFLPNYQSFMVGEQACNIKTTNQWWKLCIDLMMNSSELIIMDVSHVGTGSAWEIGSLDRRGFLRGCIFMAQEGYETVGIEKLSQILGAGRAPKIFVYRPNGEFLEPDELKAEIHRRLLKVFSAEDVALQATMPPSASGDLANTGEHKAATLELPAPSSSIVPVTSEKTSPAPDRVQSPAAQQSATQDGPQTALAAPAVQPSGEKASPAPREPAQSLVAREASTKESSAPAPIFGKPGDREHKPATPEPRGEAESAAPTALSAPGLPPAGKKMASAEHADAEDRRKARQRRIITRASIAAGVVLACFAVAAGVAWNQAEQNAKQADVAKVEAENQTQLANEAREQADEVAKQAEVERDKAIAALCLHVGRDLTRADSAHYVGDTPWQPSCGGFGIPSNWQRQPGDGAESGAAVLDDAPTKTQPAAPPAFSVLRVKASPAPASASVDLAVIGEREVATPEAPKDPGPRHRRHITHTASRGNIPASTGNTTAQLNQREFARQRWGTETPHNGILGFFRSLFH